MYMPPEALVASCRYGTSLDIFSFGHLALFVGLQVSASCSKVIKIRVSFSFRYFLVIFSSLPIPILKIHADNFLGHSEVRRREQ